jgi:hypothetical protein
MLTVSPPVASPLTQLLQGFLAQLHLASVFSPLAESHGSAVPPPKLYNNCININTNFQSKQLLKFLLVSSEGITYYAMLKLTHFFFLQFQFMH